MEERPRVLPLPDGGGIEVIDTLTVTHGQERRQIELCVGDLSAIPAQAAVDVLVISAFHSYFPIPGTLIAALARRGVSVAQLAETKAVDLRRTCSCWISQEIPGGDELGFSRILCFEPLAREVWPAEAVGDIFRSLIPFLEGDSRVRSVAMPLVMTGQAGFSVSEILPPLLEAAVNWMTLGVALERLKIVIRSPDKLDEARRLFTGAKQAHPSTAPLVTPGYDFDVFLSYARANEPDVDVVESELMRLRPRLRLFRDRKNLDAGAAWQHELFEALDACRKVLAVYSPAYLESKVCREEFNIAWARSRDAGERVLFPIYLYTAPLPTYMTLVQYVDCREGKREQLRSACEELVSEL
jgi:hypothetical protein